jgi:hypothetical protein
MIIKCRDRDGWIDFVIMGWWQRLWHERNMGDEDMDIMEETSRYETAGVQHARSSVEALLLVVLPAKSGLVLAVLGMVNWLAPEILIRPTFSRQLIPSQFIHPFLVLYSIIT